MSGRLSRAARALGLALLAATAPTSCSSHVEGFVDTRDAWTRHDEAYQDFEGRLFVDAVLWTEDYRRSYVDEYAHMFTLGPAQKAQLLEAELADHGERLVVLASVYTHQRRWNDLDPSRGIWAVNLVDEDGGHHPLRRAERLNLRNPTYRALYPWIDFHDQLWELTFDLRREDGTLVAAPGAALTLRISGAPGKVAVTWELPADSATDAAK